MTGMPETIARDVYENGKSKGHLTTRAGLKNKTPQSVFGVDVLRNVSLGQI